MIFLIRLNDAAAWAAVMRSELSVLGLTCSMEMVTWFGLGLLADHPK